MSKKWVFSKGVYPSMVSVKEAKKFSSLFLSEIVLELMLSYGLERKEAFQDDKSVFRKGQNWVFSNEVKSWFQ